LQVEAKVVDGRSVELDGIIVWRSRVWGRRGGRNNKNGWKGKMKEGEARGGRASKWISSRSSDDGKRFFRERLCGTALPLCIDSRLRGTMTR
jgi:hypothetical protein